MKPKSTLRSFLLFAGSTLLAISSASAQSTLYWDGGDVDIEEDGNGLSGGTAGTWDVTIKNWDAGVAPHVVWVNTNNDTAVFGGTAGAVTLGANVTVGGLTFNTNTYSLAPGIGPFGITFGVPGDINVSTGTSTITAAIGGSSAITKTGGGTLVLNATNTFDGGISLSAGTLDVRTAGSLGATSNILSVTGNSTFTSSNANFTIAQGLAIGDGVTLSWNFGANNSLNTISGILSGSGKIVFGGTKNGKFTNTNNTFSGAIELSSGIFGSTFETASIGDGEGAGTIRLGNTGSYGPGTFTWSDRAGSGKRSQGLN